MTPRLCIVALLCFPAILPVQAQLADGLYAVWECSFGTVTTRLYHVEAPMTVANFVGLAEGTRTWIQENAGLPSRARYYDGIAVNRVADIPERIIQTGSQNGTNSGGGPGYTFPDEFHPLRRHDRAGMLSMANSGPNSNGSQVFFTLGPLPGLDDVHSIFGEVIGGLDVLTAIGELPRVNAKPSPEVVFDRVEILRIGAEAEGFDVSTQGLPSVVGAPIAMVRQGGGLAVQMESARPSQVRLAASGDLQDWSPAVSQWHLDNTPPAGYLLSLAMETGYYSALRVDYPEPIYTPYQVAGGRFTAPDGLLDVQLGTAPDTGTVSIDNGAITGTIISRRWTPTAYRGTLFLVHTDVLLPAMNIHFVFQGPTNGYFKGDILWFDGARAATISGDFVYTPAP